MYKTIAEKVNLTIDEVVDDKKFWKDKDKYKERMNKKKFMRLRLIKKVDRCELEADKLKENSLGKNHPFQNIIELNKDIEDYIDRYMNDDYTYLDSDETDLCKEGAESSSIC